MRTIIGWIAAVSALPLGAQTASFETGVTNIHVDVSAVYQGKSVLNLNKNDFVLRDEGQVRPVLSFDENTDPLDLVFVLDTGAPDAANVEAKKSERQAAAIMASTLQQMRPFDRTAVISFGLIPRVDQELTSDSKQLAATIERIPHNTSRVSMRFRALQWAAWLLEAEHQVSLGFGPAKTPAKRKRAVFVVTSDFKDEPYQEPDEIVIQHYWGADIALNAIVFQLESEWQRQLFREPRYGDLGHVVQATGGEAIIGPSKDAPEKQIPDLFARIQSSYTLFYAPPPAKSGEVRHITVELSDEAKKKYPGAVIHAREGYIAQP